MGWEDRRADTARDSMADSKVIFATLPQDAPPQVFFEKTLVPKSETPEITIIISNPSRALSTRLCQTEK